MNPSNKTAPTGKKRGKRAERVDETRRALFSAAATVVGKSGYENASVASITKLAGVANGTFYNYFATRQELFDQLLPALGDQMLEYMRGRIPRESSGIERERQRIVAYFEFFQQNPGFLRILNEAEVFAPRAFKTHINKFATRYVKALKQQMERGELASFREDELLAIVYMLMGARSYLTMLWRSMPAAVRKDAGESFIATYIKLIERGLFSAQATKPTPVPQEMGKKPSEITD